MWVEERVWTRKLGRMDNLQWNDRNLISANSVMVGIFRWIVLLETNQGASRMDRRTLDRKLWTRSMSEAFADPHTSTAYAHVGPRIVLYIVSLFATVSLEFLLSRGLRSPYFLFESIRLFSCGGSRRVFGPSGAQYSEPAQEWGSEHG